jgi:hypothetical protein
MHHKRVKIRATNMPPVYATKKNWPQIMQSWRTHPARKDMPNYSDYFICRQYNLCPIPFITPFSSAALQCYYEIGGIGASNSHRGYFALPAFWVHVCRIIVAAVTLAKEEKI